MSKATQTRVTLKSTLIAGEVLPLARIIHAAAEAQYTAKVAALETEHKDNPEALAAALKALSVEKAAKELGATFAAAVKEIPNLIKVAVEEAAKAAEAKEKEKEAADKANAEALAAFEAKMVELHKSVIESMMNGPQAYSVEVATAAADSVVAGERAKNKAAKAGPKLGAKVRVTVVYKGQEWEMPVTGNMPQVMKDAVEESGLTRDAFIEKNRKTPAETPAESEQTEA